MACDIPKLCLTTYAMKAGKPYISLQYFFVVFRFICGVGVMCVIIMRRGVCGM